MGDRPTSLDLFCGCGGFTLGMEQAGFRTLGAIDFDAHAVKVFRENFPHIEHALQKDLTQLTPQDFQNQTGITPGSIDVIVGGPPCQGFSQVRQRDGSNHAKSNPDRFIEDPRRSLYIPYFEFVKHYQPKVFVMETVLGMYSFTSSNVSFLTSRSTKHHILNDRIKQSRRVTYASFN